MKLFEMLGVCESLMDMEVVIHDESIFSKAGTLASYLCEAVINMNVVEISTRDGDLKVCVEE